MELELHITGDIVERQELLNGTQMVTLAGATADGAWTLTGEASWNLGLVDFAGEGDLVLARPADGAEVYGSAVRVAVEERGDAGLTFDITYEIDGGAGPLEGAQGAATARGVISSDAFTGDWVIRLNT